MSGSYWVLWSGLGFWCPLLAVSATRPWTTAVEPSTPPWSNSAETSRKIHDKNVCVIKGTSLWLYIWAQIPNLHYQVHLLSVFLFDLQQWKFPSDLYGHVWTHADWNITAVCAAALLFFTASVYLRLRSLYSNSPEHSDRVYWWSPSERIDRCQISTTLKLLSQTADWKQQMLQLHTPHRNTVFKPDAASVTQRAAAQKYVLYVCLYFKWAVAEFIFCSKSWTSSEKSKI